MELFIPYNVPSSKNSKQIVTIRGTNKKRLISSALVQKYKKNTETYYFYFRRDFLKKIKGMDFPIRVGFKFYRDSKRKFDYINALQVVQDLMVDYKWIEDDNADFLIPVIIPYEYNKKNPGVKITVLKDERHI